jgi:hypothetical protein
MYASLTDGSSRLQAETCACAQWWTPFLAPTLACLELLTSVSLLLVLVLCLKLQLTVAKELAHSQSSHITQLLFITFKACAVLAAAGSLPVSELWSANTAAMLVIHMTAAQLLVPCPNFI